MMDWPCAMRKGYIFCNVKLNWRGGRGGGLLPIGLENYEGDLTREGEVEYWVFYIIVTSSLHLKDKVRVGVRYLGIKGM